MIEEQTKTPAEHYEAPEISFHVLKTRQICSVSLNNGDFTCQEESWD